MKKQQGFTLIELMIVVAIIAILAAIAIPQYQNYVARSQVTRVVGELSALKTAAEDCILNGLTTVGTAAGECDMGVTASSLLANPPTISLSATASIAGTMGGASAPAVTGTTVTWSRTADGSWACAVTGAGTGFKASYIPRGCTAGAAP